MLKLMKSLFDNVEETHVQGVPVVPNTRGEDSASVAVVHLNGMARLKSTPGIMNK